MGAAPAETHNACQSGKGRHRHAAVFLDRDGLINQERSDYVKTWEEFRFLPGVLDALCALRRAGLAVFVVTNQSAIGRGLTTATTVESIHRRMTAMIRECCGDVKAIYVCPHAPSEGCDCRKPRPGLLLRAAREHDLDLASCYLLGDKLSDIEAGEAVGCRCALVTTGLGIGGTDRAEPRRSSFEVFGSLADAVEWVIADCTTQLGLDVGSRGGRATPSDYRVARAPWGSGGL